MGRRVNRKEKQMKTIQMTIDESLLSEINKVISELKTSRSAFIRSALRFALENHAIRKMEQQHAQGYARHPVEKGEFDIWENEQSYSRQ
jgi:metal-responsive CopG/Arc/MetJ family transcriptional regulator